MESNNYSVTAGPVTITVGMCRVSGRRVCTIQDEGDHQWSGGTTQVVERPSTDEATVGFLPSGSTSWVDFGVAEGTFDEVVARYHEQHNVELPS